MARVLIIDDDADLCELVAEYLQGEGLEVEAVHDGVTGVVRCLESEPDLVILDVMLPGLGGFDVLSRIRERSKVPVIMLTARGEDVDRIVGLEMGADDYLSKPFNPRELVARIRAILRRTSDEASADSSQVHSVGDLRLDVGAREVRCGDHIVDLTGAEFMILEMLVREAEGLSAGMTVAPAPGATFERFRSQSRCSPRICAESWDSRPMAVSGSRPSRGVGYVCVKHSGSVA